MRKTFIKFSLVGILAFVMVLLTSCKKDEEDEILIKPVQKHGTVDIGGSSVSGLTVMSLCGESQVGTGGFDLDMPEAADLNVIFVTNSGECPVT